MRLSVQDRLDVLWLDSMSGNLRKVVVVPEKRLNVEDGSLHGSDCNTRLVLQSYLPASRRCQSTSGRPASRIFDCVLAMS